MHGNDSAKIGLGQIESRLIVATILQNTHLYVAVMRYKHISETYRYHRNELFHHIVS